MCVHGYMWMYRYVHVMCNLLWYLYRQVFVDTHTATVALICVLVCVSYAFILCTYIYLIHTFKNCLCNVLYCLISHFVKTIKQLEEDLEEIKIENQLLWSLHMENGGGDLDIKKRS